MWDEKALGAAVAKLRRMNPFNPTVSHEDAVKMLLESPPVQEHQQKLMAALTSLAIGTNTQLATLNKIRDIIRETYRRNKSSTPAAAPSSALRALMGLKRKGRDDGAEPREHASSSDIPAAASSSSTPYRPFFWNVSPGRERLAQADAKAASTAEKRRKIGDTAHTAVGADAASENLDDDFDDFLREISAPRQEPARTAAQTGNSAGRAVALSNLAPPAQPCNLVPAQVIALARQAAFEADQAVNKKENVPPGRDAQWCKEAKRFQNKDMDNARLLGILKHVDASRRLLAAIAGKAIMDGSQQLSVLIDPGSSYECINEQSLIHRPGELGWNFLVPDVVIHETGDPKKIRYILDFKFPCLETTIPRFPGSTHQHANGRSQGKMYRDFLKPTRGVWIVSPKYLLRDP